MTGKEGMELGLDNIYKSFFEYRKGKKPSIDLDHFQYHLEHEIFSLCKDLETSAYKHGGYRKFTICDNKKREISIATVRDRVVHRMFYDYLTEIYDKTFISDVWSCQRNKGLIGAIERAQVFMKRYKSGYVWRGDIRKFFDSVDHEILLEILMLKITNIKTFALLKEIITSFNTNEGKGMPIGNLTSQIFSNIYLNEFDRHIKHTLNCKAYLRYGDDFVIFNPNKEDLFSIREKSVNFLEAKLKLTMHPKNDFIIKTKQGLKFLGVHLFPGGRRLNKKNTGRIVRKLTLKNAASYSGIIKKHSNEKEIKKFQWLLIDEI